MPDPIDPSKTIIFKDTDFQDLIYQTAYSHSHNLTVSGGNERSTFYAGLGYMDSEGTAITTKYKRLSFSLNGSIKLRDNLNVVGRVMYTTSSNNEVFGLADIFYRSATTPIDSQIYIRGRNVGPGTKSGIGNPVYHLKNDVRKNSKTICLFLSLPIGKFCPDFLSLRNYPCINIRMTVIHLSGLLERFHDLQRFSGKPRDLITKRCKDRWIWSWDIRNYFAESHNLDVKAGFSYFGREKSTLEAKGSGAATDLIPTLNAAAIAKSVKGDGSDQVIAGFFARVNYDYKDRYLVSLSARYDGASNLGDDHKWGFFPEYPLVGMYITRNFGLLYRTS